MDLRESLDENAFRATVREFATTRLPTDIRDRVLNFRHVPRDDYVRWQRILAAHGWGAPAWPLEYGGAAWNATQRNIFDEECFTAGAPRQMPFGLSMVGPVLQKFGTPAQQAYFLPRIVSMEDWWCQGYSEPGAGSDLASLKTRAGRTQRDGQGIYIVNGQKTWTSFAHWADWIFCLVRTNPDAKPQEGISFLLIDMKTPGVTVRPIIMVDGAHHVNDVFFDNVKVPVANLIGKENEGWTCAKFLLANERLGIAEVPGSKRGVRSLWQLAHDSMRDDPSLKEKIADVDLQVQALEMSELRALSTLQLGGAPGPEASILKVRGSEIQQRIAELAMEAVGEYAAPYQPDLLFRDTNETPIGPDHAPPAAPRYFNMRKTTIYGGSTEIQKNIVSKAILGL
jgi:alkylation response protein AidB-like acyl-CoA dehydrogenase